MSEPLKSPLSRSGEQYDDLILQIRRDSKGNIIVPETAHPSLEAILNQRTSWAYGPNTNIAIEANRAIALSYNDFEIQYHDHECTIWYSNGLRIEIRKYDEFHPIKICLEF